MDLDSQIIDQVEQRVEVAILADGQEKMLINPYYGIKDDVAYDCLDEVAVEGKVILWADKNPFWGGRKSQEFFSEVLENPTWLRVNVEANRMMAVVLDPHHVFVEGINRFKKLEKGDGIKVYEFSMGS